VWISRGDGLFHVAAGATAEQIGWASLGRQDSALALLPEPGEGGLWLGFFQGGVAYLKDGKVRQSYAAKDGLGEGRVEALRFDRDGAVWASTEGGLSRIKDGKVATLSSRNGLPCDAVHWMMGDDHDSVWVYLACGLARIARAELDAWTRDPKRTVSYTVFDASDGVASFALGNLFNPQVSKSADGRIWFVSGDGVSVIDPRHIPFNKLPPPAHIEQITGDRKIYWRNFWGATDARLRLPKLSRDLRIDYTALSLVAPEKVRFKYNLEGHDDDWVDAGARRQAFYNDLRPRSYRFRVMASNNSGVWKEAGDSFDFSIDPAYYQTRWFQALCAAAFLSLLWALYQYRLHQIAQRFNTRLDERTRIARDLHDTLLQSFHGLMFRYQAAHNMVPRRPEEAMEALDRALDGTEKAVAEGRDAIHNLRASTTLTNELAQVVTALGSEMSQEMGARATGFQVVVEGSPHHLHPILRDEVYAIAREAVRNAFRHAEAHEIEVEITYGTGSFRLRVRDDGKGIDPAIAAGGRGGHYGVPGMRERAKRIGGKLDVWAESGAGTEVELTIPRSIAYGTSAGPRVLGLFGKRAAKE
jgi:signal transduction histidine kinase